METTTIIHTEASHGWGGQEMRTLTECRWFRDQGFRCVLMAKEASPIAANFSDDGFEVIHLPFTRSSQLKDFVECVRTFRKLKPALVGSHSNIDTRVALAAAASAGVKRRVRYRHVSIPVRTSPWNKVIYRHLANHIVTTAHSISEELVRGFSLREGSTRSIPTGVRDAPAGNRQEARDQILRQLGLPEDSRLIMQVSVLRDWKGHAHLIDAFDQLAADDSRLQLVLVGKGNMLEDLKAKIRPLASGARIHFPGHAVDPYPYFQAADIVALASTGGEGVPQSTLQAFACARPFVGTRIGGIPDIVTDSENGLLVPPADPVALAAALSRLLADPAFAARLGDEAKRTFERCGSINHMGESLRTFLNL